MANIGDIVKQADPQAPYQRSLKYRVTRFFKKGKKNMVEVECVDPGIRNPPKYEMTMEKFDDTLQVVE